jgi:nitrite reductase/ring-hydroxylating ferredoxin subunit
LIAVLDPDVPPATVERLTEAARGLGFEAEFSRGDEQSILSFSGSGDPRRLEDLLVAEEGVDAIPLLPATEYRLQRTRRRLMSILVIPLGLAMAFGWAWPIWGFLAPPPQPPSAPNFLRAASVGELAPDSSKTVMFHNNPVILIRTARGQYHALRALCTYAEDCALDWNKGRQQLTCPCHGCAYDIYGNIVQGPPSIPLVTYEVSLLGEGIFLRRKG